MRAMGYAEKPLSGKLRSGRRRRRRLGEGRCGRGNPPSHAVWMVGKSLCGGPLYRSGSGRRCNHRGVSETARFLVIRDHRVGGVLVFQLALPLLVAPLRRKPEALDAEMGIVECGIRCKSLRSGPPPPAASYQGGWLIGYAKKENGSLVFQPRTAFTGSVVGSPVTFQNVTPLTGGLRTPVAAPWYLGPLGRGRTVVFLKTDRGVIEVSGSVIGLKTAGAYPTEAV